MREQIFSSVLLAGLVLSSQAVNNSSIELKELLRIEQATPEILHQLTAADVEIEQVRGLGSARLWQPRGMAEIDLRLSAAERRQLEADGLRFLEIPNEAHAMWESLQQLPARDRSYHDYNALTSALEAYANTYPELCELNSIGQSIQGRELWVLTISDNPGVDEDEPEFKYISTMHGDEPVGTELLLELVDDLLTGYDSDPRMSNLVDEVEIHILPMMNPDGNAMGQRGNANGVDLNRNFPDPYTDPINTPAGRAVETGHVILWTQAKDFDLSANFHTGALLVNYPRDNNPSGSSVYTASPDDDLFIEMSEDYSGTNLPMWNGAFFHGISNGAEWYAVSGGMQDWNYVYEGGMEVTVELNNVKWPSSDQLPGLWDDNRESMLSYMEWVLRGVRGVVSSSLTGLPLAGVEVQVQGRNFATWSAAEVGDYHRILPAGTWNLEFSKAGYQTRILSNVVVGTSDATRLDVQLVPLVAAPDVVIEDIEVQDMGNGVLDPGESSALAIQIGNAGTLPALDMTLSLTSESPWVLSTGTPISSLYLDPDASSLQAFNVSVSQDAPIGELLSFALEISGVDYDDSLPFSLPVGLVGEDFESESFLTWPWQMSGDADWMIDESAQQGSWCAKSGSISHNNDSQMALVVHVAAAGDLSFQAKASSEANYDYLRFYVDGQEEYALAGDTGWQLVELPLETGEHTLLWSYEKDGSVSNNDDAAYVDDIRFPPLSPSPEADIAISPEFVNDVLEADATSQHVLLLENNGEADLNWQASVILDDPVRVTQELSRKLTKGENGPTSNWNENRNTGGPDAFGYSWVDSREDELVYQWEDISTSGVELSLGDDDNQGPYDLGFAFDYYGNTQESIRICSNGFLSFSSSSTAYSNGTLPATTDPDDLIAPFWDDLSPNQGGNVYYKSDTANNRFIVQWSAVPHYNSSDYESFQVILSADHSILFQYQSVADGGSCTVGVENMDGTDGLGVIENQSGFLEDGLAIRFSLDPGVLPWAVLSPLGGTVSAGSSTSLNLSLDATDMADGIYTGRVVFQSNDPDQAQLEIPIEMEVSSTLAAVQDLEIHYQPGSIELSWTAIPGATAYWVETSSALGEGWSFVAQTTETTWNRTAGSPETCLLRVRAIR